MGLYVGCSGWYYRHWRDLFYKGVKQSDWFGHYASRFNTVELNSTFYRFPKEGTARGWYRKAPEGFVYTLKANRLISHTKGFKGTKGLVRTFYRAADVLKEKQGCILFQVPPSIEYSRERLAEIMEQLEPERRNAMEFRHPSWWRPEVYRELKRNGVIFCIVDAPGLPGDFIKTAGDIYVRLHGKEWYRYDYSEGELVAYAERIRKMKAGNVFCYFNNDFRGYAVKNALRMGELLAQ